MTTGGRGLTAGKRERLVPVMPAPGLPFYNGRFDIVIEEIPISGGARTDGGGNDGAVDRGGTGGLAAAYGITPLYGAASIDDK